MASMNQTNALSLPTSTTSNMPGLKSSRTQVLKAFLKQAEANHKGFLQDASNIRPRKVLNLDRLDRLLPGSSDIAATSMPPPPSTMPFIPAKSNTSSSQKVDQALLARVNMLLNMAEQQCIATLALPQGEQYPKMNAVEQAWLERRQKTFVANIEAKRREVERDDAVCRRLVQPYDRSNDPDPNDLLFEEGELNGLLNEFYGPDKEVDMYEGDLDEVDMIMTSPPGPQPESPVAVDEGFTLQPATGEEGAVEQDEPTAALPEWVDTPGNDFSGAPGHLRVCVDLDGYTIPSEHLSNSEENWQSMYLNLGYTSPPSEFQQLPSTSMDIDNPVLQSDAPEGYSNPINGGTQHYFNNGYSSPPPGIMQPNSASMNVDNTVMQSDPPIEHSNSINNGTQHYLAYDESGQLILVEGEPEAEHLVKRFPNSHLTASPTGWDQPSFTASEPTDGQIDEAALRLMLDSLPTLETTPSEPRASFTNADFEAALAEVDQMNFSGIETSTTPINTIEAHSANNNSFQQADPFYGNPIHSQGDFERRLTAGNNTGNASYDATTPMEFPALTNEEIYIGNKIFNCRTGEEILASTRMSASPPKNPQPATPQLHSTPQNYDSYNTPTTPTPKPRPLPGRPRNPDFVKVIDRRTPTGSPEKNVQNVFKALGRPVQPQGRPYKNPPAALTVPPPNEAGSGNEGHSGVVTTKKVRAKPSNLFVPPPGGKENSAFGKRVANGDGGNGGIISISDGEGPPSKKLKWKGGGPGGGGRYIECDTNELEEETPSKKPRKSRAKPANSVVGDGGEGGGMAVVGNTSIAEGRATIANTTQQPSGNVAGDVAGGLSAPNTTTQTKKKRASGTKKPKKSTAVNQGDTGKDNTKNTNAGREEGASTTTEKKKRGPYKKQAQKTPKGKGSGSEISTLLTPSQQIDAASQVTTTNHVTTETTKKKRASGTRKPKNVENVAEDAVDGATVAKKKNPVGRPRKIKSLVITVSSRKEGGRDDGAGASGGGEEGLGVEGLRLQNGGLGAGEHASCQDVGSKSGDVGGGEMVVGLGMGIDDERLQGLENGSGNGNVDKEEDGEAAWGGGFNGEESLHMVGA